jgi:DNA-binding transcriptional MerR regulator
MMQQRSNPLPKDDNNKSLVRIGDLARRTGVAIATLRYYESEGLIECVRTRTKYRLFSEETVETVQRIVHLKSLKIPLIEIRRILKSASLPAQATREHYQELKKRLAHILEQKSVWDEQERIVRLVLASLPEVPGGESPEIAG